MILKLDFLGSHLWQNQWKLTNTQTAKRAKFCANILFWNFYSKKLMLKSSLTKSRIQMTVECEVVAKFESFGKLLKALQSFENVLFSNMIDGLLRQAPESLCGTHSKRFLEIIIYFTSQWHFWHGKCLNNKIKCIDHVSLKMYEQSILFNPGIFLSVSTHKIAHINFPFKHLFLYKKIYLPLKHIFYEV